MLRWRNAPGRRGMEMAKVDGLVLVRRKGDAKFWLQVRRGVGPLTDEWGPFSIDSDDPIRDAMTWNDTLIAKKWFEADLRDLDPAAVTKAVRRLPRSSVIPHHLLQIADAHRIAMGKGLDGDVLHVGAIDVRKPDGKGLDYQPRREKTTLTFSRAGARPYEPGNVTMRVDGLSLEALIGFLLSVRMDLVSKETAAAMDHAAFHDDRPLPNDMSKRIAMYYEVRDGVDRMANLMMGMSREKREFVLALVEQVAVGDVEIDIVLPPHAGKETPHDREGGPVH